jgi:cytochrome c556
MTIPTLARNAMMVLALALAPAAAMANAAAAIEARQANFKAIGRANKAIQDELKKPRPSVEVIRENAAALERAAQQIPRGFPAGSGPEAGVKTEALPAIWRDPQGFSEAAGRNLAAVRALRAAAEAGDLARVRAAAGDVGPTCKACHDRFRGKS